MARLWQLIRQEGILCIALILALLSMFFNPPSLQYFQYINWKVLILLFCLMAVVAGWRHTGLFPWLSQFLLKYAPKTRSVCGVLVGLCFFSSTLLTNDVALIIFVPLTFQIWQNHSEKILITLIVLETIAANLGSLLTPIGNPKNLFLYDFYQLPIGEFFQIALPVWFLALGVLGLSLLLIPNLPLKNAVPDSKAPELAPSSLIKHSLLFLLCILTVLKLVPALACLGIVGLVLLLTDRQLFKEIDYSLLLTFVCFFIFVDNLATLETVQLWVIELLEQRVFWVSILLSQVISDVPAAIMLAPFTFEVKSLLLGVNLGGLGTLIASMASLISYKLYARRKTAQKGRYFLIFSLWNFSLLLILALITKYLWL